MASKSDIEAGRAFVRLFLKNDMTRQLSGALKAAGDNLKSFGKTAMLGGAGLTTAGVALAAPIIAATKLFADMGSEAVDAAGRTGLTVEAISELKYAAEQTGATFDNVEGAVRKMAQAVVALKGGSKGTVKTFKQLGLTAKDLDGLSVDQQFQKIGEALAGIGDANKRADLTRGIFGRSATTILPMLKDLDALRKKAREAGLVMDGDAANAADDLGDAIDTARAQVKAMAFQIGAAVAGPITDFLKITQPIIADAIAWVKANKGIVATVASVAAGLVAAGSALVAFGAATYVAGMGLTGMASAVTTFGKVAAWAFRPLFKVAGMLQGFGASIASIGGKVLAGLVLPFRALPVVIRGAMSVFGSAISAGIAAANKPSAIGKGFSAAATAAAAFASKTVAAFRGVLSAVVSVGGAIRRAFTLEGIAAGAKATAASIGRAFRVSMAGAWTAATRSAKFSLGFMLSMGRSTAAGIGAALRGVGAGIGRGVGGLASSFGMLASFGGPMLAGLSQALFIIPALGTALAALVSPAGLVAAALVAGGIAWTRYSESGRAALASLMPIIETLKTSFGGVKDALATGDWELAGKIAMAGLKLAIMQGLVAIQQAFPNAFANVLRVIGRIGDGIVTAWGKVTGFLKQQWDNWGAGTLKTIMEVASLIPDIWQRAVEGMANFMLERSAKGGVMGKMWSNLLGVDMANEQERAKAMEEARRPLMARQMKEAIAKNEGLLEQAKAAGDTAEVESLQKSLEHFRGELAKLEGPSAGVDVLADAREAVKQYVDGLRQSVGSMGVDAGTGQVSQALEDFLQRIEAGGGVEEAAAELAKLREQAAKERAAKDAAGADAAGPADLPTKERPAFEGSRLTATYSAAAASIGGFAPAMGAEERMAGGIDGMVQNGKEMLTKLDEMLRQNIVIETLYQQFLAGWKIG